MSAIRLANRYAKAILDLAIERDSLEEVSTNVREIQTAINGNRDLALMLKSPIIQADKKEAILKAIFDGRVDEMLTQFMSILVRKRREKYLGSITDAYIEQYNVLKHIKKVKVTTAVQIDEALIQRIAKTLKEDGLSEMELEVDVDPELLGGYVLRYGDREYDASVLRNLNYMRSEFSKNTYVKKY
ncbi:MAG: F-type H+-transporting ATPase subunit delta [Limisphaerales bacterium]|jgi:F-type H+-transporting ATPase subunit delta